MYIYVLMCYIWELNEKCFDIIRIHYIQKLCVMDSFHYTLMCMEQYYYFFIIVFELMSIVIFVWLFFFMYKNIKNELFPQYTHKPSQIYVVPLYSWQSQKSFHSNRQKLQSFHNIFFFLNATMSFCIIFSILLFFYPIVVYFTIQIIIIII